MHTKPKILKKELLSSSRLFGIERLLLRFSNGVERQYERLATPSTPAVMIVPLTPEGEVVMIREYCCGTEDYQLTLPKGAMDPGESVFEAANRELMEEVGMGAKQFTELKPLTLSPGYMGHRIHVVLAEGLYPERREGDEPEPLEVVMHRLEDMEGLLATETCTEARMFAALYIVRDIVRARAAGGEESNDGK